MSTCTQCDHTAHHGDLCAEHTTIRAMAELIPGVDLDVITALHHRSHLTPDPVDDWIDARADGYEGDLYEYIRDEADAAAEQRRDEEDGR